MPTLRCNKCPGLPELEDMDIQGLGNYTDIYKCKICGCEIYYNYCEDY